MDIGTGIAIAGIWTGGTLMVIFLPSASFVSVAVLLAVFVSTWVVA